MGDSDMPGLEGLVVAHIFRSISRYESMKPDGSLILELPFSYITDWTGARGRGRPREKVKDNYRVDRIVGRRFHRDVHGPVTRDRTEGIGSMAPHH